MVAGGPAAEEGMVEAQRDASQRAPEDWIRFGSPPAGIELRRRAVTRMDRALIPGLPAGRSEACSSIDRSDLIVLFYRL